MRIRLAGWQKETLEAVAVKFVLKHSTIFVNLIGQKKLGLWMQIAARVQNEQLERRK